VLIGALLAEQAEGENVSLLVVGLVVLVIVRVVFNSLDSIAGDQDISGLLGAEDSLLHEVMADTIYF